MKQNNAILYVSTRTLAHFCIFLALAFGYFFNRLIYEACQTGEAGMIAFLLAVGKVLRAIRTRPVFFSFRPACLLAAAVCWVVSGLIYYYLAYTTSIRRLGEEHGSATWGTEKDAAKGGLNKSPGWLGEENLCRTKPDFAGIPTYFKKSGEVSAQI